MGNTVLLVGALFSNLQKRMYALSHLCRRLCLCLLAFFAVGRSLTAASLSTGSATVGYTVSGTTLTITALNLPAANSSRFYVLYGSVTDTDGGFETSNIFTVAASGGAITSWSGAVPALDWTSGGFRRLSLRELEPGSNIILANNSVWFGGAADYKIRTMGTNNSDQTIRIGYVDASGDSVLDITVQPGESWDETVVVNEADGPFTPVIATQGQFSDGVWFSVPIEDATPVPTGSPVSPSTADPVPETSTVVYNVTNNTVNNNTIINNQSTPNSPGGGGSPWLAPSGGTVDTERLDKTTFRQGVDKLEVAIKASEKQRKADADALKEAVEELTDENQKAINEAAFAALEANPEIIGMQSAGSAAGASSSAVFGSTPGGKGYALTPGGAPVLAIADPFSGQEYDLNPLQNEGIATAVSWFRQAVAWLALMTFASWVWGQVAEWTRGMSTLPQAKGNPVVAGTGAQATALLAAGLMTTAVITAMVGILAWSFDDINIPSLVSLSTTNPMATIPAGAYWMLDQFFPIATLVTCVIARMTFNMYASTIFATTAAIVRFIVP